jgi:cell division protein ZapE
VAAGISARARLLCFDELHVTDIADAMILGRLFQRLFDLGVTIVATSNAHPSDLYKNGLNRALFLPFIAMLEEHMAVIELKAAKDFRLERLAGVPLYFTPDDAAAHAAIRDTFRRLTGRDRGEPETFDIKGHQLVVPEQAMGVAILEFAPLCEHPYGAGDYLQLARSFHTILLEHVPRLSPLKRDAARRFINLVDTLYDNRTCLILSAGGEPDDLYPEGDSSVLFERTASRLHEMRSQSYLESRAERALPEPARLS